MNMRYIIEHNIDLFIELDIDCVGLKEVEQLRKRLEKEQGSNPSCVA